MQLAHPLSFRNSLEIKLHSGEWKDVLALENLSHEVSETLLSELGTFFPFMPHHKNHQGYLPRAILKNEITNSVTFYGGSFNPFHEGHMACLDLCPEKNIVVVLDHNPFKIDQTKSPNLYGDFLKLVNLFKEKPYSIYSGFADKKSGNPTSTWLPFVAIEEKNLLLGDDSFMDFLKWKNPDIILKAITKIYVVPRIYHKEDYQRQIQAVNKIKRDVEIIILPDHPYKSVSSSNLRSQGD